MWPRAVLTVALRGPGKVLLLASAFGWIALGWMLAGDGPPHAAAVTGHGHHAAAPVIFQAPAHFTAMWMAMILAMAPPMLMREIGTLWRASLRRLRHPVIAWFLCGYAGVWLLAGVVLAIPFASADLGAERMGFFIGLVAIWHCSPARQRCLNACHRVPALRAFGAAAQWDALRYGVRAGCSCAAACGLVMLLALRATDHHLAAMVVAAAVATFERHLPARRPAWQLPLPRGLSRGWPEMRVAGRAA